jgi:hypothetical protein
VRHELGLIPNYLKSVFQKNTGSAYRQGIEGTAGGGLLIQAPELLRSARLHLAFDITPGVTPSTSTRLSTRPKPGLNLGLASGGRRPTRSDFARECSGNPLHLFIRVTHLQDPARYTGFIQRLGGKMDIRPLNTDDDYRAALAEVSALVDLDPEPGTPDGDRLEILSILVEHYESLTDTAHLTRNN